MHGWIISHVSQYGINCLDESNNVASEEIDDGKANAMFFVRITYASVDGDRGTSTYGWTCQHRSIALECVVLRGMKSDSGP